MTHQDRKDNVLELLVAMRDDPNTTLMDRLQALEDIRDEADEMADALQAEVAEEQDRLARL